MLWKVSIKSKWLNLFLKCWISYEQDNCIRWSYNHKYLDGFWHHKSSQETATGMMESCFMVQKNHEAKFHLGDAYLISFLSKMRIAKPNRELWRLDIVMLVKRLARCLACSKWLVYFASCCVWKHLVNADVGISVIVPRAQGGISQEGRQIWKTWGWTQREKLIRDHLQMFFNVWAESTQGKKLAKSCFFSLSEKPVEDGFDELHQRSTWFLPRWVGSQPRL